MMKPRLSAVVCRVGVLSLLGAGAAGISGCSGNGGSMFARSDAPPPPLKGSEAIDRGAYEKLGYALAWSGFAAFNQAGGGTAHRAAVLGDLLVVADDTTATSALTTTSGSLKWALQTDNRSGRFWGLARVGGSVLAINQTEVVQINAETGQLMDRQTPSRLPSTSPIVFGDLVVFGAGDMVLAHSLSVRDMAWAYRFPAPVLTTPVPTGGTTGCFVSTDGTVAVLDCGTGSLVGSGKMFGNAGATPVTGDGAVFVPGVDQSLWAFNIADGSRRWQVRTEVPLLSSPAFYKGHVMVHVQRTGLVSVDSKTGSQQWVAQGVSGRAVAARKGNLIFFDRATGVATSVDPANGDIVAQVTLPNVALMVAGGAEEDGDLYTVSPHGEVSKFVPR
ncbi:MAG: PQQ-binding-like beta-propeller repeat protein [Phycisphaerales bacterium]|nr:PQQ-binding-like beta-propeller repeat protein [Phycisphaerales bacterium]